jgi:Transposase DDE domain
VLRFSTDRRLRRPRRFSTDVHNSSRYSNLGIAVAIEDIAKLYNVRWTAETHFAELKTTLKMRKVKSMTPEGVKKELAVYCLVYNLVHAIMLQAAARQGVPPDRISFIDTVRWLLCAEPGADMPDLIVNPNRPGRHEPRVTKDRQDTHPKMCRPRNILRKDLKKWANNA